MNRETERERERRREGGREIFGSFLSDIKFCFMIVNENADNYPLVYPLISAAHSFIIGHP